MIETLVRLAVIPWCLASLTGWATVTAALSPFMHDEDRVSPCAVGCHVLCCTPDCGCDCHDGDGTR